MLCIPALSYSAPVHPVSSGLHCLSGLRSSFLHLSISIGHHSLLFGCVFSAYDPYVVPATCLLPRPSPVALATVPLFLPVSSHSGRSFLCLARLAIFVRSSNCLCLSSSVVLVFSLWCLLLCLSGAVAFSGRLCLVCVCISFSVFYGPSLLTNPGSDSDSGSGSLRAAYSRTISCAFSAHPAGLRSTHCVFVRSLLVGFSFRSCWHWFRLRRCLSRHASCTTLSKTRTLSLTAFGNTHIDTNRNLAQTLFLSMHSSIISSFLALAHIRRRYHFSSTRTYFRRISMDFFQTSSPSFSYAQTDRHYSHVVPPCILLGLLLQRGFAVVVAKRCCRF